MTEDKTVQAIATLRDPKTIRARCEMIFAAAEADTVKSIEELYLRQRVS